MEDWGKVNHSRKIAHVCRFSGGQELSWLYSSKQKMERHKRRQVREVGDMIHRKICLPRIASNKTIRETIK